ncbi:MAG: HAMP domain-containing sensor histidine kinase [Gammaproteobacteria bacterium]|nr:HAMP domain-containing sensor histidine kinase [Gammaproteobacteria bacterium]
MELALVNLLSNAIDAVEDVENPRIEIAVITSDPEAVTIAIRDNGVGINADDKASVFELFYTTKPPGKGTGLGLVNVSRIAADHGGRVDVVSSPGQGAEFRICFPRQLRASTASLAG